MDELYFLVEVFDRVDLFLLILVRLIGFFTILPIITGANIPGIIRMALSVGFAFMVYTSGLYGEVHIMFNDSMIAFFFMVIIEFAIGFTMAYVVYMIFATLYIVGQFMDNAIGFNMVSVMDPAGTMQAPVTGNLLYLMSMVLLIQTGGLHRILGAFFSGFSFAPIGTVRIFDQYAMFMYIIELFMHLFVMGMQIAMPIVGAILLINTALGMLVKASPQMNIFVVGIPLRILLGILLFFALMPIFGGVYHVLLDVTMDTLTQIIIFLSS